MPIPELRPTVLIDNRDVPHLLDLEARGRTSHVHWDGCEVQRQFYVNHYSAAPHVCAALLGFVLNEGAVYKRYLPASDPIYDRILYCNEARWDHVDKQSISAAAPLNATAGNVSNIQAYSHLMWQINRVGENKVTVTDEGLITEGVPGGAFITASYRPLISAYHGDAYSSGPGDPVPPRERQFDFMDPQFVPGSATIPWPLGVETRRYATFPSSLLIYDPVPEESAEAIRIPVNEFSIRRMFLGRVPYEVLDAMVGTVNSVAWPVGNPGEIDWPWSLPQFPAETLRFENYEATQHWSQSSFREAWFEVRLVFSHRNKWDVVYDRNAVRTAHGPVTWNHAFFKPGNRECAWWYLMRDTDVVPEVHLPLHPVADFYRLFAEVTPPS